MIRSESGAKAAVYLGSFTVAMIGSRVVQTGSDGSAPAGPALKLPRTVAFVGLMGVGKSCIGRKLAAALDLPFVDADKEIEAAAGCSVRRVQKALTPVSSLPTTS